MIKWVVLDLIFLRFVFVFPSFLVRFVCLSQSRDVSGRFIFDRGRKDQDHGFAFPPLDGFANFGFNIVNVRWRYVTALLATTV